MHRKKQKIPHKNDMEKRKGAKNIVFILAMLVVEIEKHNDLRMQTLTNSMWLEVIQLIRNEKKPLK